MEQILNEAFQALKELNEDMFELTDDGIEKAQEFIDDSNEDDFEIIIDPEADTEEDVKDSYVDDLVLQCQVCGANILKDENEIKNDEDEQSLEDEELVGTDIECPECHELKGYKIIGRVAKYEDKEEDKEDSEDNEDTEEVEIEETEKEKVEESIKTRKSPRLKENKSLNEMSLYDLKPQFDSRASFYNKAIVDINDETGEKILYSYNTPVVKITKEKELKLLPKWDSSTTTLRHVKDFLKQNGFTADSLKQIKQDYLQESTTRDDIDAKADNKKEKARKVLRKKLDDADADRDYQLKRKGLKEAQDVTDQVIININEPGYLTKKRDLEGKGYKRLWTGEGKICMAKPKSLKEMDNVYDVRTKQGHKFLVKAKDEDSAKDWANKNYRKTVKGDFDIDKATKTNKTNISESDKPAATSIEDAQKWVDYDMKKYGRISERTNRLVKKAGFQILKDNHGDYEVVAGTYESLKEAKKSQYDEIYDYVEKKLKADPGLSRLDKCNIHVELEDEDQVEKLDNKLKELGITPKKRTTRGVTYYDFYAKEDTKNESIKSARGVRKQRNMREDFNRVDIETDREKMTMTSDDNGKVTVTTEPINNLPVATGEEDIESDKEVIVPLDDEETKQFADIDIDEIEEKDFDELGEKYLRRVYENVKSFKTKKITGTNKQLKLEGLITFKSGKQAKTNFVFETLQQTKTGKLKFIGENKQFAKGNKAFILTGRADNKKLFMESLTYNYTGKDDNTGETKRVYGRVIKR